MKIKIKYFNILREIAGVSEEFYSFSSIPTIQTVIDEACLKCKSGLRERLFETSGEMKPGILVFLNSKFIEHKQLNKKLNDNDEIYLFPVISGG
ncbi:MAG: MoaD/ThiS family protein [Methanosarcinaceae archaeon]|jgi:MoaD family protein